MEYSEVSRAILADVSRCVGAVNSRQVDQLVEAIAGRRRIFMLGTGRSGAMLQAMGIRLGHLGIHVRHLGAVRQTHGAEAAHASGTRNSEPATQNSKLDPAIGRGDLLLIGSGSGKTPMVLEHAQPAHDAGAEIVIITADHHSPAAQMANLIVHIPAYTAQAGLTPHTLRSLYEECLLIVGDTVCRMLQERLGVTTREMHSRHSPVE